MARPKSVPTLADFGFNQETIDQIEDLREAWEGAPAHRVLTRALKFYLEKGIGEEPTIKELYELAKGARRSKKSS
jgi:hypothetical protein